MRRKMLREVPGAAGRVSLEAADIPEEIALYVAELKLLYPVPYGCLVPEEELLPPESIRFFCLDENWCNALAEGALSIGRCHRGAARRDQAALGPLLCRAEGVTGEARRVRVHENHRGAPENVLTGESVRSGFLLRSRLAGRWKGLEVQGYHGEMLLPILRMDMPAADVVLGIFGGELDRLVVSEPKAGLRFGVKEEGMELQVREIREEGDFGCFRPEKITLKTRGRGCLDVMAAKGDMEKVLGAEVTPSVFAFELMQAAQEARFTVKGGKEGWGT